MIDLFLVLFVASLSTSSTCATHQAAFVTQLMTSKFSRTKDPSSPNPVAFTPRIRKTSPKTPATILYFDHMQRWYQSNSTSGSMIVNNPTHGSSSSSSITELSLSLSDVADAATMNVQRALKVYCDMDGVLVDFEKGVMRLLSVAPSKLVKGTMWKAIARTPHFFENLEWKQDGRRLWMAIRHLKPDILTGVPYPRTSRVEKFNWCKRELGLEEAHFVDMAAGCKDHECVNGNTPKEGITNVITCWSKNKYMEAKDGSVLIDDRITLKDDWENAGGIFIHHVDTDTTLQKLRVHGILNDEPHH